VEQLRLDAQLSFNPVRGVDSKIILSDAACRQTLGTAAFYGHALVARARCARKTALQRLCDPRLYLLFCLAPTHTWLLARMRARLRAVLLLARGVVWRN